MRATDALRVVLVTALAGAAACGGGRVVDSVGGPTSPTLPPNVPTVQRTSITVRVVFDGTDAGVAAAAGLTPVGTTVRIQRSGTTEAPRTGVTGDDNGTVRFDNLLEGVYHVSVEQTLTPAQVARLPATDSEVTLFAGGVDAVVSPPDNGTVEVSMVGNRRGSVIISEIFPYNNPLSTNLGYNWGSYLELYNNADTTSYLDGMIVFRTPLTLHGGWPEYPCGQFNQAQRLDPSGLPAVVIHQFPGNGRDFPIRPGEARVIAVDAMNHNAAAPGMQQVDLSKASFEQIGSDADIDNPFVPDMIRVTAGPGALGRGYPYVSANIAHVLALPSALSHLSRVSLVNTFGTPPSTGTTSEVDFVRRQDILDVLGLLYHPDEPGYGNSSGVTCSPFLSPVFERAPAPLVNTRRSIAIARRSLGFSATGREILQRTGTSARDFEYREPLMRSLRKPN